jgi:hypothetical protein
MIVGNGVTDYHLDVYPAYIPTLYQFQMINQKLYDDFNKNKCFFSFRSVLPDSDS